MGSRLKKAGILVFWVFGVGMVTTKSIHSNDPSGKLDFGSPGETTQPKNEKLVSVKIPRNTDFLGSASEITRSVSCGTGGCNATQINNNTVETEVLIHVQTKLNLDQDQKKRVLDDTADVPIVVGYQGASHNSEPFDRDDDRNGIFNNRGYEDNVPFRPTYTNPPINIGSSYNQRNGVSVYNYGSSTFRPPIDRNYYAPPDGSTTPIGGFYRPTTARPLDLQNGYPRSPLNLDRPNHYNNNRVELQIPYFEHGYNKHYFREEPPPHNIWLDKGNTYNPVEFRRMSWTPSSWNGRNYKFEFDNRRRNTYNEERQLPGNNPSVHHDNHGVDCSCRNLNTAIPYQDTNIYSASSLSPRIAVFDKKSTIDNKLAPLN